jgi:2-dehydro-3-deoxygluconokinase
MKKVVTLGEIMLRLTTPGFDKIEQARNFAATYGGGEANVAISLAQLGLDTSYVTKLPENPLGHTVNQFLTGLGVGTEHIIYGGERLGIYYLEKGHSIRSSKVIYDRKYSSFAMSKVNEYDFDAIFEGADWFHLSGITPALNEGMFELSKKALQVAKEKGITTSCDLNYRSKLWTFEDARRKMAELAEYVDLCIGVEPLQLLGEDGQDVKDSYPKPISKENYKEIMQRLKEHFGFEHIVMTFRNQISVNTNILHAMLLDGDSFYESTEVEVDSVDRVGTGDAFSAGMVYALLNGFDPQHTVDFATACFALKHTIEGDANLLHLSDVEQFLAQKGSISITR